MLHAYHLKDTDESHSLGTKFGTKQQDILTLTSIDQFGWCHNGWSSMPSPRLCLFSLVNALCSCKMIFFLTQNQQSCSVLDFWDVCLQTGVFTLLYWRGWCLRLKGNLGKLDLLRHKFKSQWQEKKTETCSAERNCQYSDWAFALAEPLMLHQPLLVTS